MRSIIRLATLVVGIIFCFSLSGRAASVTIDSGSYQRGPDVTTNGEDSPESLETIPPLGPTGIGVTHVNTFGETEVPYYDEPGHLNTPGGVAVDGNRVWIAEFIGKRALLYNADGSFEKKIGRSMMYLPFVLAEIPYLCDLAVGPDHNVWLDFQGDLVKVDPDGQFLDYVHGGPQLSYGCKGLAVDESGRLFVSDYENHFITVYDSNHQYLQTIGTLGSGDLQFNQPANIAVKDGLLFVAEVSNNRIQIINVSDLNNVSFVASIQEYQANGSTDNFDRPSGVNVDASRIFVADSYNDRVQVFDRNTYAYVATLGNGGHGIGSDQWNRPYDIAVDINGRIYVSDMNNHRVQQFTSNLALQHTFGEPGVPYLTDERHFTFPESIQADRQGNIYVSETRSHRVIKLTPDGEPIFSIGEPGILGNDTQHFNTPIGLAVDAQNRLYVADSGNHRIQVFDQSGNFVFSYGSEGDTNNQFSNPSGVAINPNNGDIFVADTNNFRYQVFDSSWNYITTIGETGVSGIDHQHFNNPYDVAVDVNNNIYLTDNAERLEKCTLSGTTATCLTLVGEAGVKGDPYFNFQNIQGIGVDANGLVYMVDHGLCVLYVYDSLGRFYGSLGGFLLPKDVTVDSAGNIYVTDSMNQRLMKFSVLDLDWKQVNIDHFGDNSLGNNPVLVAYNNYLYAGYQHTNGAQIWRMNTSGSWQQVSANGIDDPLNQYISTGMVYNGLLYFGAANTKDNSGNLTGATLYRHNGASWEKVASSGFGEKTNFSFSSIAEFKNYVYIGTSRADFTIEPANQLGAQIWRSPTGNTGSWSKVLDFSTLNPGSKNFRIRELVVSNNSLFAAVDNITTGSEIWRTDDGASWVPVATGGLGLGAGLRINALEHFNNMLYIGASFSNQGARIWRCQTCTNQADLEFVMQGGFNMRDQDQDGQIDNNRIHAFRNFRNYLYAWTQNLANGSETWRSRNGIFWEKVGEKGLGVYADNYSLLLASQEEFNSTLYAGTDSTAIWRLDPRVEVFNIGTGSGKVNSNPPGIDCGEACSAKFPQNVSITLTASPAPGSVFSGWSGEGCSGTAQCTILADQWRTVSANFEALPGTKLLTVDVQGNGSGLITSIPTGIHCGLECQAAFPSGTSVQLVAQSLTGTFTEWSGSCTGSDFCQVQLTDNRNVVATFTTHAPLVSSFTKTGVVNSDLYLVPSDFDAHFYDQDGDNLIRVKILALPTQGTLKLNGQPVISNQEIPFDDLAFLFYQPALNFQGSDSFTWTASDGLYQAEPPATVTLTIMLDGDGDAIGNQVEANVPPLDSGGMVGDGNGDNMLDAAQGNVSSQTYITSNSISRYPNVPDLSGGFDTPNLSNYFTLELAEPLAFIKVFSMPYPGGNSPDSENAARYPFGFIQFEVKNVVPGTAVDIILYVDASTAPDRVLYYGAMNGTVIHHLVDFSFDGQTGAQVEVLPNHKIKITLHFVDGLRGDSDLTANGFIRTATGAVNFWNHIYLPFSKR